MRPSCAFQHFFVRMTNSGKVSRGDLRVIFGNIEFIRDFHANFLSVLEALMSSKETLTLRSIAIGKLLAALVRSLAILSQTKKGVLIWGC